LIRFSGQLGHYPFPLSLRGAIQKGKGFAAVEATQYLERAQSRDCAGSPYLQKALRYHIEDQTRRNTRDKIALIGFIHDFNGIHAGVIPHGNESKHKLTFRIRLEIVESFVDRA